MPARPQRVSLVALALCLYASAVQSKQAKPVLPAIFPLKAGWTLKLEGPFDAPLATDGTRVFLAARDGLVQAVDVAQGQLLWKQKLAPGTWLSAREGLLVARQADGTISRLDPAAGTELWTRPSGIPGTLPAVLDDERILVAGEGIAALAIPDGRPSWGAPGAPRVVALPTIQDDLVYVVEEGGRLRARRRRDGSVLWEFKPPGPALAPAGADAGRVFLGTQARALFALRASKGTQRWRRKLGADVQTQPVAAGKLLLVASHENVLYGLNAGNGHLTWRAPLPSRPLAGPLVFKEAALVACREFDLVGFDLKTGVKLGALRAPGEIRVPPLIAADRVILALRAPWALTALAINQETRSAKAPSPPAGRGGRPGPKASPAPGPSPAPPAAPLPSPTPSPAPTTAP